MLHELFKGPVWCARKKEILKFLEFPCDGHCILTNKMDKHDDIFNIEIDPTILLSYELDEKLNLVCLPNDILEIPEEISKNEEYRDNEKVLSPENIKSSNVNFLTDSIEPTLEDFLKEDKLVCAILKKEVDSDEPEKRKDINGNEELSTGNFHGELQQLEFSDSESESEEENEDLSLRERAGDKRRKHENKKHKNIPYSRKENYDKKKFNHENLLHLAGSKLQSYYPNESNSFGIQNNLPIFSIAKSFSTIYTTNNLCGEDHEITSFSTDTVSQTLVPEYDYEDSALHNLVSSPESGYDTSASIAGSPPRMPSILPSIGVNFENVDDEQYILDLIVTEYENLPYCASSSQNSLSLDLNDKNYKEKLLDYLKDPEHEENACKERIFNLLKAVENEEYELSNTKACDISKNSVPSANNFCKNIISCTSSALLDTSKNTVEILKNAETPIVCKPLNIEAKVKFRGSLCDDKVHTEVRRIYQEIIKDKNNKKDVRIIYVEDETDKASENKTNLHRAVQNSKFEEIYCLVEIHKQHNKPFSDLNLRDKNGKTALDYAIQSNMTLVVDYLKENNACPSLNI